MKVEAASNEKARCSVTSGFGSQSIAAKPSVTSATDALGYSAGALSRGRRNIASRSAPGSMLAVKTSWKARSQSRVWIRGMNPAPPRLLRTPFYGRRSAPSGSRVFPKTIDHSDNGTHSCPQPRALPETFRRSGSIKRPSPSAMSAAIDRGPGWAGRQERTSRAAGFSHLEKQRRRKRRPIDSPAILRMQRRLAGQADQESRKSRVESRESKVETRPRSSNVADGINSAGDVLWLFSSPLSTFSALFALRQIGATGILRYRQSDLQARNCEQVHRCDLRVDGQLDFCRTKDRIHRRDV